MGKKILVVEDESLVGESLKIFLEENDYDVLLAENGEEGLQILSNQYALPDLIISDIIMPLMDGYDFYFEVVKHDEWNKIPFIFLTGKNLPDDIKFGKLLGVDDYITKPFEYKEFISKVHKKLIEHDKELEASKMIENRLNRLLKVEDPSFYNLSNVDFYYLYYLEWKDNQGPEIYDYYPRNEISSLNIRDFIKSLYKIVIKINDFRSIFDIDVNFMRITKDFLNAFTLIKLGDEESFSKNSYMICLITPNYHYLKSQRFKDILYEISHDIEEDEELNLARYWEKIIEYD